MTKHGKNCHRNCEPLHDSEVPLNIRRRKFETYIALLFANLCSVCRGRRRSGGWREGFVNEGKVWQVGWEVCNRGFIIVNVQWGQAPFGRARRKQILGNKWTNTKWIGQNEWEIKRGKVWSLLGSKKQSKDRLHVEPRRMRSSNNNNTTEFNHSKYDFPFQTMEGGQQKNKIKESNTL